MSEPIDLEKLRYDHDAGHRGRHHWLAAKALLASPTVEFDVPYMMEPLTREDMAEYGLGPGTYALVRVR